MRFKWLKQSSEQAVVCMAVARIRCKGTSIEEAITLTLKTGHYAINSSSISKSHFQKLHKAVAKAINSSTQKIS